MLLFLVVLAVVVVLFAANMEHRSSFSYIFGRLEEVPVFMALLVAFIAGALTMLPFTIGPHRRRRRKHKQPAGTALPQEPQPKHAAPQVGAPHDAPPDAASDAERGARKRKERRRRGAPPGLDRDGARGRR